MASMARLDRIRSLRESMDNTLQVYNAEIADFVEAGGTWQELAFIDKYAAAKVCKQQEKLPEHRLALDTVKNYLRYRGVEADNNEENEI